MPLHLIVTLAALFQISAAAEWKTVGTANYASLNAAGDTATLIAVDGPVYHSGFGQPQAEWTKDAAGAAKTMIMDGGGVCGVNVEGWLWCKDDIKNVGQPWNAMNDPADGKPMMKNAAVSSSLACGVAVGNGDLLCGPMGSELLLSKGVSFDDIAMSEKRACGLKKGGGVACTTDITAAKPQWQDVGGVADMVQLSLAGDTLCGVTSGGAIKCAAFLENDWKTVADGAATKLVQVSVAANGRAYVVAVDKTVMSTENLFDSAANRGSANGAAGRGGAQGNPADQVAANPDASAVVPASASWPATRPLRQRRGRRQN